MEKIQNDTIAAIATPVGEGGIGIIRLSGSGSLKIADGIFEGKHGRNKPSGFLTYTTHYGLIRDKSEKIDEVILTVMRAPKTYTREDVVEINCHSGIVPLRKILELVLARGARIAEPGEFTKRAFLSGRIDLSQAEAVADVVRAKTDLSLKAAMGQLQGGLSKKISSARAGLLNLLADIEASIDFPEEDTGDVPGNMLAGKLDQCRIELEGLLKTFDAGRLLKEGVSAAIIGRPNVGKSSLLNCLVGKERAIVTSVPGTTTDTIEETMDVGGVHIRVIDTAGIGRRGKRPGIIEAEGIRRAGRVMEVSQLLLLVLDGSQPLKAEDRKLLGRIKNRKAIILINKIDLRQKIKSKDLQTAHPAIEISAKKNRNIDKVRAQISREVWGGKIDFTGDAVLTSIRHKNEIGSAVKNLRSAGSSAGSAELASMDIREAINALGRITGETITEDILDRIFDKFCIGK
ncbi:tRNA uridine-5-carboxymethylaminomethyl(34) synthesis GTPase MnmE [Candidatus Desantisbacteria bacterium CG_4_10_14_0_8_um_filter_48_22]|uniref:tRNA modification GTPase MnmE n=1 Tax=Candidatus Desantisbacteria bacterium CG_4_10_14_0_8_um_filter_48_22 TaxID=1974543 RepID=A0A2M7SDK8_9BACT|nr:MAG: tRNA uridine-5-carboxymethylaminomethyl(34) synthesis GTPase MnmE [Candidatus Desantisbacteria bacterium CG1_02_49_89]PIV57413.1 MAG: tRNA uridine-5-carboxymethylaminomethyl(34) synthesis GTPase MnmE [Candidatus Desantisbacteria bacterium CG02_land_8_20_14_3_00_49_13]PIZ17602.1 MAG: tRNA uridine-5-carboxymethylaminomethyl(34) synthesis GTPase MnmE [Candidatus Desantisbacteria bacterium CG_4_10_14_0_8_um_filter_48_22]PJB27811.1 MAG: tRNA uridine-5-carboxymethylaminomethyl(34) synthesis GT